MQSTLMESTKVLKVSDMAETLVGSEIIKLGGEIRERISQGEKIYNFTIGDFDPSIFPIPTQLKDEIVKAYEEGETNYPAANGMLPLRKAVSRFLHTRGGLEYNEEQLLIAGGARPLIYATYQTIVDPGDKVIFPVPSWNNNHYSHLAHANAVYVETSAQNNFMPTAESLKKHISEATLIALCSPLNPAGTIFGEEQLEAICDLILEENKKRGDYRKPVYLLYDQIYWMLCMGDNVHHDPVTLRPGMKDYTIFIDGLSKTFAATGVRIGWAFGPQKIINKMKSVLGHIGAWAPKAEQIGCARFFENDDAVDGFLNDFKGALEDRLMGFYDGFKALKEEGFKVNVIAPKAAIYLTVQFNLLDQTTEGGEKLATTERVGKYLLDEAKVALVPFYAFGASKKSTWFRLSVGTSKMEEIPDVLNALRAALKKLS